MGAKITTVGGLPPEWHTWGLFSSNILIPNDRALKCLSFGTWFKGGHYVPSGEMVKKGLKSTFLVNIVPKMKSISTFPAQHSYTKCSSRQGLSNGVLFKVDHYAFSGRMAKKRAKITFLASGSPKWDMCPLFHCNILIPKWWGLKCPSFAIKLILDHYVSILTKWTRNGVQWHKIQIFRRSITQTTYLPTFLIRYFDGKM